MQRIELARELIYDGIARLLPTMGRDFKIELNITPGEGDIMHTDLKFIPLTDMGRAIAPLIKRGLTGIMQQMTLERGISEDGTAEIV